MSRQDWDFSSVPHGAVPRQILRDWSALVLEVAAIFNPGFSLSPLPEAFEFREHTINSDGPYGSSENFYTLSEFYFLHQEGDRSLRVSYEEGRQFGGDDAIVMETDGASISVFSGIPKRMTSPLAFLYITVILQEISPALVDAAEEAIVRHHYDCGGV